MDQLWVWLAQLFIAQAHLYGTAEFEVLAHDIAFDCYIERDRLAVGG
jgi:hypothetical protein